MKAACGHPLEWRGLYDGQHDLWVPDAFQHPAKQAPGLTFRILEHLSVRRAGVGDMMSLPRYLHYAILRWEVER